MSQFSEYLKTLVEESGSSVSALARAAGLNRPNLQNVIGGSRKPARGDVEKLLPHLRVSAAQQSRLLELLEGELLGEDIVERRAYVQALLERMDQSFRATPVAHRTSAASGNFRETELFSGNAAIHCALVQLLAEGAARGGTLAVFPGFPTEWLRFCLSVLCGLEGQAMEVVQFQEFWKAPQAAACTANLDMLSVALPLLLNSQVPYELRYTYAAHIEPSHPHQLFPFCLVFPQAVFLLHRNGEQAMVLREQAVLRCWQEAARTMRSDARPLFNRDFDTLGILRYYNSVDTQPHRFGFLESQPCLVPYADPEILDRLFSPEIPQRKAMAREVLAYAALLREQPYIGLFYEEGLRLFAETGFIRDLPQGYSAPASMDIRRTVLERLYEDCAEEKHTLRIAKPWRLRLPQDVVVAVREYVGTHFVLPVGQSNQYCNIQVDEATITEAFLDFITAMACSDAVYTKEETLEIIRRAVESVT